MRRIVTLPLLLALALAGCAGGDGTLSGACVPVTTSSTDTSIEPLIAIPQAQEPPVELQTCDVVEGQGEVAATGDELLVHYAGVSWSTGQQFDASWDRDEPFSFQLGAGMVIQGWDLGLIGMRVGGRRELIIPSFQAYGPEGRPPVIAENETLVFVVDLLSRDP